MANEHQALGRGDLKRVRLSEWARQEGISRITAYRMLKKGILPVPHERSPTGRWYVLLPRARAAGRMAAYLRSSPGERQITDLNDQLSSLADWIAHKHVKLFTVVREIADPADGPLPRLERLIADRHITHILIENPALLGTCTYGLLVAALAPQGRTIIAAYPRPRKRSEAEAEEEE